jgi:PAS domain S-box-containing protein
MRLEPGSFSEWGSGAGRKWQGLIFFSKDESLCGKRNQLDKWLFTATCFFPEGSDLSMGNAFPRKSLSKRLSLSLGLLSTVVILAVSGLVFITLSLRVATQMEMRAESTIDFLAEALKAPLWALDRESAAAVAKATSMDTNVGLLELRDSRGEEWFAYDTGRALFITREVEVVHEGQFIGSIRLGLEDSPRQRTLWGIGLAGGGIALLVILAQYFLAKRILRHFLHKPFAALDSLVAAYGRGDYTQADPDVDYVEFEPLVQAFLGMGRTIERHVSALAESEEKYRAIFDHSPVGIFRSTLDGELVEGNPALGRMFGYLSREDFLGRGLRVDSVYADAAVRGELLRRLSSSVGSVSLEVEFIRKDGSRFDGVLTASIQQDAAGRPAFLNGVVEDVSERKQIERDLAQERMLTQAIFESVPGLLYLYDSEGRLVRWNKAHEELMGFTGEEIRGRDIHDWFGGREPHASNVAAAVKRVASHGSASVEAEILTKDGRALPFYFSGVSMVIDGSFYLTGIGIDITERKQAEERLRQSEEKFSRLFRLSPDVILLMNMSEGRIIDVNEAFSRLTGFTRLEAVGRTALALGLYANPSMREVVRRRMQTTGQIENIDFSLGCKDGRTIACVLSSQLLNIGDEECVIAVLRDVTEFKRMQELMIQSEKMISVGGIAAGVAHEINNPLGIIMVSTQNLMQRTRLDFPKNIEVAKKIGLDMNLLDLYMRQRRIHDFVRNIQDAAVRAADIIRHMLDFSRRNESKRTICDLRAIIERALHLAGNDYGLNKNYDFKKIELVWDCESNFPSVSCNETEMEQVFLNLLRNAAQAMSLAQPEIMEPRIVIRMKTKGERVVVEVEDNGPGMPPEVQRRAFEPFFTTKPPGVGTGLGLSVSYFIITRSHDGQMLLESHPGRGTRFIIELPVLISTQSKGEECIQDS